MGEIWLAAILGVLEGLTEFIPVSSTGHLILAGSALNFNSPSKATFEICIQSGAVLAVIWLYLNRFKDLLSFKSINGKKFVGVWGIFLIAVGCFPPMLLGLLFHDKITELLFSPKPVAVALIFGGVIMILLEKRMKATVNSLDEITPMQSLLVGLIQSLSLWPGMSRSGSSIIGGMFSGMSKEVSAEYSFLMAVPLLGAASAYQLLKTYNDLSISDLPVFLVGTITAFITSIFAIKFMMNILRRFSFAPFGWYRIVIGALILALL